MISVATDAAQTETHLTLMTKRKAFIITLVFAIFTVIFGLISFLLPSTLTDLSSITSQSTPYTSLLQMREEYTKITNFNNFIHFSLTPAFANPSNTRKASISIAISYYLLSDKHIPIEFHNFTKDCTVDVMSQVKPINLIDINSTYFSSLVAFVDVRSTLPELQAISLEMTTLRPPVSIAGLTWSSVLAVLVSILLLSVVARRVRPSAIDHWCSVILCGLLFFVDGPWLVCQYFAISGFSVVYDLMPQLFHACFIIYMMIFFGARTAGMHHEVFSNHWIHLSTFVYGILVITLQFGITSGRPLAMFPIVEKPAFLYVLLCILFFIFHLIVIIGIVFGFSDVKVERVWSLILVIGLFMSLEIINIAVFLTRMFVSSANVGSTAAADLFYILEANLVTFFLVYVNTPISMSSEQGKTELLIQEEDTASAP